jgi:hypothetical protein
VPCGVSGVPTSGASPVAYTLISPRSTHPKHPSGGNHDTTPRLRREDLSCLVLAEPMARATNAVNAVDATRVPPARIHHHDYQLSGLPRRCWAVATPSPCLFERTMPMSPGRSTGGALRATASSVGLSAAPPVWIRHDPYSPTTEPSGRASSALQGVCDRAGSRHEFWSDNPSMDVRTLSKARTWSCRPKLIGSKL